MYHNPVMLSECIEGLSIKQGGVYVDLTFGGSGHSREIMQHLDQKGRLIAFDQDEDTITNTIQDTRFTLVNQNFRYMKNFLRFYKAIPVDGILADLGISSHHIDDPERGFATRFDGPLDMRMNRQQSLTAAEIVNTYTEDQLRYIFNLYGELDNSKQLAFTIVKNRSEQIETVEEFKNVIRQLVPKKYENKYLAQVFQALRIEVNDELGALKAVLKQVPEVLSKDGRLVVISYHSLEDRIVKNFIRSGNIEGKIEKDFFGNKISSMEAVNRKAIVPTAEEMERNPRSRSAKLRIAIKN
ncbi:MAG: 16S rRNA (cytosine(1402)-N(4))-methyltransferase RsmH [Bacteroidetes bacterium]|nr:16S rRNA (cytosine(1402)-N(4))-methyltransferase RsmH [Bacteroidota bacterium]